MFNMVEIMENILSFLFVYFFFSFFPPPTSPSSLFLSFWGFDSANSVARAMVADSMAAHRCSKKKCGLCDANCCKPLAQFVSV